MRIGLVDYGVGNLHSLAKALEVVGGSVAVYSDPVAALNADVLVLPGVGAFAPAAAQLNESRVVLRDAVVQGHPAIGICLGMQLMFDGSDEGSGEGLGVFSGQVSRVQAANVPHMGWNTIDWADEESGSSAPARITHGYYANSYVCRPLNNDIVMAWTTHENDRFPAIVRSGNAVGIQFHPEKSSEGGIALLQNILREVTS